MYIISDFLIHIYIYSCIHIQLLNWFTMVAASVATIVFVKPRVNKRENPVAQAPV